MLERLTQFIAGDRASDLVPTSFVFDVPLSTAVCVLLLAVVPPLVGMYYWRKLADLSTPARTALVAGRCLVVLIALFLAVDPSVIAQHVRPGEQIVALLFDDSQSMRIGGQEGASRGTHLVEAYQAKLDSFEEELKRRHQVVRYRVGATTEPIESVDKLTFEQLESDLIGGVANALTDLEGTSVSAVVLFSDGVQQTSRRAADAAEPAIPDNVPVYTVGVDSLASWSDIELANLSVKRTDFDKSPVVVNAQVHSQGLAGRKAMVEVLLGSRVVKSKLIEITEDPQEHDVRLEYVPDRKDWIEYQARVRLVKPVLQEPQPGADDRILENDARRFTVDNRDKAYRILFFSGRPNWENKFTRRALEGDKQLKLTSLIAISNAEQKFVFRGKKSSLSNPLFEGFGEDKDRPRYDESVFLRMNAEKDELVSGYPSDAEEMFEYDLVIWGDVERAFFTTKQLEVTREYVEKRGGTLLLLGGRNSFTEGDFSGTIVEGMMPMLLYRESDKKLARIERDFSARPTMEGILAGSWVFDPDELENSRLWEEMPTLFGLNEFPLVRAGATIMAETFEEDPSETPRPLFAVQRYGEGKCAVLATGDTWQWQMRLDSEDDRHGRFWRQLVRNLLSDASDQTVLRGKRDAYTEAAFTTIDFLVRDGLYDYREGLQTTVSVTTPDGTEVSLPVDESIQEAGLYKTDFQPEQVGLHRVSLTAMDEKDEVVGTLDEAILVEPDRREFQKAQYNPAFLAELADGHGGRLFALDELDALAASVPVPVNLDAEQLVLHLWHLPGFYLALVLLLIPEWYLRRKRGLA